MKRIFPILLATLLLSGLSSSKDPRTGSDLRPADKKARAELLPQLNFEGKACHVYGKIKFVENFADFEVKFVEHHADLEVKYVDNFADESGEWQIVQFHEDYRIKPVRHHEDFTVKVVENFPGCE
ncbi:MAG: hypothetical protein ABEH38_09340 [Flavobacteriales bacterium]